MRSPPLLSSFALLLLTACSSTSSPTTAGPATADGGASGGDASATADAGGSSAPLEYKSYVILGDSISDRGGSSPYFYDLLPKNVDATYPDYKGKDFGTRYPGIKVVKNSKGGAQSVDLVGQVNLLQETLPGPVVVSVTIGGNDMQANAVAILQEQDQAARDKFKTNLTNAYDALMKPGRFGADVKVKVYQANIYDPSDGEGNFAEAGCPAPLSLFPKKSTVAGFDGWNKALADALAKYGSDVVIVDMRGRFQGSGVGHFTDGKTWFEKDCIHPNAKGHDQIRRVFWEAIVK